MLTDEIIAPDGKQWYLPIPPQHDRAVFCRPYGVAWILSGLAKDDQGAATILSSIALEYGNIETAVVMLDT